jgi:HTH-type transcriptional regulator/antitoxin HigA
MEIRPIRTEGDYEEALREIAALMEQDPDPGTEAFDRLDVLVMLVEAYEEEEYDLDQPVDPVEVIEYHLDRLGWPQAELARKAEVQRSHLSAVLNGKRSLSLTQIKKISLALDIPPGRLIDRSDVAPLSA